MPKGEIIGNIFIDGKGIGKGIRGLIQFAKEMEKGRAARKSQGNRLKEKLNIWPRFVYVDEAPWNCVKYG